MTLAVLVAHLTDLTDDPAETVRRKVARAIETIDATPPRDLTYDPES